MNDDKTATELLREMLDARGVEWEAPNSCQRDDITQFHVGDTWYEAFEINDGIFQVSAEILLQITPDGFCTWGERKD